MGTQLLEGLAGKKTLRKPRGINCRSSGEHTHTHTHTLSHTHTPIPQGGESREKRLALSKSRSSGSKLGKEYVKAVYTHPAYLTYMQSTSCKMLGWMKHKLESRLLGEISTTSDKQVNNGRKIRGTKEPLDEGKRGVWKNWLNTQHSIE